MPKTRKFYEIWEGISNSRSVVIVFSK